MKQFLITAFTVFACSSTIAQYSVDLIPDSLKKDANAVKRMEERVVVIRSNSKAVVRTRYAITVLNEKGSHLGNYMNSYTKLVSLSDIGGKLFDATGKVLRTVKKKDIADMSMSDDMSLLTDVRVKRFSFGHYNYPYTVEFEDEVTYDGIYFLPQWHPVEDEHMSVMQSKFVVEVPLDYQLRYKQIALHNDPAIAMGKTKVLSWEIKGYMAVVPEPFQPPFSRLVPNVLISPSAFEIGGLSGDMSSWKNLGLFVNKLNEGRDALPEKVKEEVRAIAGKYTTNKEKIEAIFQYMQQHTRYVSVQLGIGSWQPFDAKYVASNKYGDCKALSNYMVSLLKEANIKANYVLINSGEEVRERLIPDFPSPYFNHAIVCVPNGKDSIWLECTSQTVAPGYMGTSTGNRLALLVNEEGGHLVRTPVYKAEDNVQRRRVDAKLDANGTLRAVVRTVFSGEQQELAHSLIHDATPEQRTSYLNRVISLPTYKVIRSEYKETKSAIPEIEEILEIEAPDFTNTSGKRLFLQPNLFNRFGARLQEEEARKYPIELTMNYLDYDTVNMQIPEGYSVETMPAILEANAAFGTYLATYTFKENTLQMIRTHRREPKVLLPTNSKEVRNYFDSVRKADNSRAVFVKKE